MKNLKVTKRGIAIALLGMMLTTTSFADNRIITFSDQDVSNIVAYSDYKTDYDNYIPYTLNMSEYSNFTSRDYEVYKMIINNVLNHVENITKPDDLENSDFVRVAKTLQDSEYWTILETLDYNKETKILTIYYRYPTKEECIDKMNTVHDYMQNIINEIIEPDMNDLDKIMVLYKYVVDNFKYDKKFPKNSMIKSPKDPSKDLTLYETIYELQSNNKGVCHSFSFFMGYVANMLGIKMSSIRGKYNGTAHMWLIAEIDGNNYYFDPTFDITHNTKLQYFGLTKTEREKGKITDFVPDNYAYDMNLANENTFKDLRNATNYNYIGNHIFEIKFGKKVRYYNTETKLLTKEKPESITK